MFQAYSETVSRSQQIFENLIDKKKLSELLGVSKSFINKLMTDEGLPYVKLGRAVRFQISDVVVFLEKRRKP